MEVHPPDHPLRTWGDFWIHLGTITIGLLIALGLEATVEWAHRVHRTLTALGLGRLPLSEGDDTVHGAH